MSGGESRADEADAAISSAACADPAWPQRRNLDGVEDIARALLGSSRIVEVAQIGVAHLDAHRAIERCAIFWSSVNLPTELAALECAPHDAGAWAHPDLALAAWGRARLPADSERTVEVLPMFANGACCGVLVAEPSTGHADHIGFLADVAPSLALVSQRISDVLHRQRLESLLLETRDRQRMQRALYAISDLAGRDIDTVRMLRNAHRILRTLMYARNFFVALYDKQSRTMRFPYFADEHTLELPGPDEVIPESSLPNSLTVAVLHHGRPLMGPSTEIRKQLGIELDPRRGPESVDWLGVPMLADNEVCGAVVVQSYDERVHFTPAHRDLLSYVAQHILIALTRRQTQLELEKRVESRTQEIAAANRELKVQIRERESGERLQSALFRIAELTGSTSSMHDFYAALHAVIGELIYARNFFVAILVDDGNAIDFPYAADEVDPTTFFQRTPLRRGLTDHVLRSGHALLATHVEIDAMQASGVIERKGAPSRCWMGVPLSLDGRVVGALVVQSYTDSIAYNKRDQELLTFVSFHIANALQRKRGLDQLTAAHTELERHVDELRRTQAELLETEKMASLGRLVAGVAHEVNTPLGVALTAVSFMRDQVRDLRVDLDRCGVDIDTSRLESAGKMVQTNIDRAARLVGNFKQVAVDQSTSHFRVVRVRDYLDASLQSMQATLRHSRIRVDIDCDPLIELSSRPDALHQVLVNLVMNAVSHAYPRGDGGLVRITVLLEDERIQLVFADSGDGMPPEIAAQMFEPFFTTRRDQGGTGLGLHIVYNLVTQALGGRIACETAPGNGARFEIVLPALHPDFPESATAVA